ARVMLTANIWTEAGLVNGSLGTIHDILFEEPGPPCVPTAVFISFDDYKGPTVTNVEGVKVVTITPIRRNWEDLGGKEFAAGLSFVATSRVRTLKDLLFKPFSFERLQRIKECKRLQERKKEEER
ncbi:2619_t:CDS:2, partial [Cetraspora pellucida]